jgi:hypothetical protein
MISANLMGGLGNQMFQIMTAYAHSRDVQDDLYFDFGKCYTPNQGNKSEKYLNNFFKFLKNDKQENHFQFIHREPSFSYNPIPKEKNLLLNGYFQSEKYFEKYKSDIKTVFNIDESKMRSVRNHLENMCSFNNLTSIHVRRGDYLKTPDYHPTLTIEYYEKCMQLAGNSKFIILSDDMEWCKKTFTNKDVFFSDFTDELDDLYLIMMCDNKIMSNSSFSWWGSYLSPLDGKIFAPKNWFGVLGPKDTQDIYGKNWKLF